MTKLSLAQTAFLALALAATHVCAQAPATPTPTGSTSGSTTTKGSGLIGTSLDRPKTGSALDRPPTGTALGGAKASSETDKHFFKEVSEAIVFEQKLATLGGKARVGEESKKAFTTINDDLKRVWEKFATLSTEKGATISMEVSKSDASKVERISKQKADKLEKELLDDLGKETKKTSRLFETTTLQDPDLKKFAEEWRPTIKGHEDVVEKAEKALGKK